METEGSSLGGVLEEGTTVDDEVDKNKVIPLTVPEDLNGKIDLGDKKEEVDVDLEEQQKEQEQSAMVGVVLGDGSQAVVGGQQQFVPTFPPGQPHQTYMQTAPGQGQYIYYYQNQPMYTQVPHYQKGQPYQFIQPYVAPQQVVNDNKTKGVVMNGGDAASENAVQVQVENLNEKIIGEEMHMVKPLDGLETAKEGEKKEGEKDGDDKKGKKKKVKKKKVKKEKKIEDESEEEEDLSGIVRTDNNFVKNFNVDFFRPNHRDSSQVKVKKDILVVRMRKNRSKSDICSKQIRWVFKLDGDLFKKCELWEFNNLTHDFSGVNVPTIFVRFDKMQYQKINTNEKNRWKNSSVKSFILFTRKPTISQSHELSFSFKLTHSQKAVCNNTRRNVCKITAHLFFVFPKDFKNEKDLSMVYHNKSCKVELKYVYDSKRKEVNTTTKPSLGVSVENSKLIGDVPCLFYGELHDLQ